MTGLQDKITWTHIGQFWSVTPGADSNFTKAVSSRRGLFTQACNCCCWEDVQVQSFWLARWRGRALWHGGSPVRRLDTLPYKWFSPFQALLSQQQHPLLLQSYALPVLCGQDRKWELRKKWIQDVTLKVLLWLRSELWLQSSLHLIRKGGECLIPSPLSKDGQG